MKAIPRLTEGSENTTIESGRLTGPVDARRAWSWVQVEEIDGGVLTITEGSREWVYVVKFEGEVFTIRNTASGVRYRLRLSGLNPGCTCRGAQFGRHCKHRLALEAIAQNGGFA